MRYRIRHIYGRYEIVDGLLEHVVCYSYCSEYAQNIIDAMNTIYEIEGEIKEVDV